VPSKCNVVHLSFIEHYFITCFGPSDVQVVMFKNSAAHCNAIFFPPTAGPVRPKHIVKLCPIKDQ
jgi:hypothetical protein